MLEKRIDCDVEYAEAEVQLCPNGVCNLVKTASERPDIFNDVKLKKNHAYLYVIAMGAGDFYGENKNGDFFWEKDLKDYYKKFLTSGVFIQHDNKDPNKSKGKVLKAEYNDKMHRVELLIEVKKDLAPDVYYAIENGERIAVSMGTKVTEEHCSYCGHVTKNSLANRCEHLKYKMHQIMPNGVRVFAINHPPLNFFDISIVRKPADTQGYALFQKVASDNSDNTNRLLSKTASKKDGKSLEKLGELVKRIDAWGVTNPLSFNTIQQMRKTPVNLLSTFLNNNNILLRPSEMVAYANPVVDEVLYSKITSMLDNMNGVMCLIKFINEHKTTDVKPILKVASVPTNETLEAIKAREFLVKQASLSNLDVDSLGNKRVLHKTKKQHKESIIHSRYAQFRLNLNNGNSLVTDNSYIDDVYEALLPTGAVDSVYGIMPNGIENVLWVNN